MIKHPQTANQLSSSFQNWFLNEIFFQTISSILEDISINSSKYFHQDKNMESLTILIESIHYFQNDNDEIRNHSNVLLLIDPIIKCLCSSFHIDILKKN